MEHFNFFSTILLLYLSVVGDDPLVSVQVRGGPESQMSTTWVQIVELRPTDAGIYSCIATNERGTARATAHVEIAGLS